MPDDKKKDNSCLVPLMKEMSEEIRTYRQRQLTAFREAVIVQALVTWGVCKLDIIGASSTGIPPINEVIVEVTVRLAVGLGCLIIGYYGKDIIMSYARRIKYIRVNRNNMCIECYNDSLSYTPETGMEKPFFPVYKDNLKEDFISPGTSEIYSRFLMMVSYMVFIVNVFLASKVLYIVI